MDDTSLSTRGNRGSCALSVKKKKKSIMVMVDAQVNCIECHLQTCANAKIVIMGHLKATAFFHAVVDVLDALA